MLGLRPGLLRASFGDLALGVLTVSSDDDAEAFEGVAPQLDVLATAGDVASSSVSGLTLLRVARPK